jgi:hypothetical protein
MIFRIGHGPRRLKTRDNTTFVPLRLKYEAHWVRGIRNG